MYDTERNALHLRNRDNNLQQPYQHIHLKDNKQVLQCTNSKMLFVKRNFHNSTFKDKSFKLFYAPNQHNCCVIVLWKFLPLEISHLSEWSIDSTAAFPCKTSTLSYK